VRIDERVASSLRDAVAAGEHEHRAFLDIEDVTADSAPGVVYGIYVNLPEDPTPDQLEIHHVGNVSLFGVERARNPRGDQPGHDLRLSMEITNVLDRLATQGTWTDGTQLDVTFRPLTLEPPAGADDLAPGEVSHVERPITVGRVSVHFA
jgi:tyrosinase